MDWSHFPETCACKCHHSSGIKSQNPPSVSVTHAIEAVIACRECLNLHTRAIVTPADPEPLPCPEMSVWVDPPSDQGDGAE